MSGIDEIGMKSCECTIGTQSTKNRQYWLVKNEREQRIGYYNPKAFREEHDNRRDEYNPNTNRERDVILADPVHFIESIKLITCNICGDNIREGTKLFDTMLKNIFTFVTGDVFPTLRKRE